jgi:3,4-dihydroxy-2-butanone 4-phosphate synthase
MRILGTTTGISAHDRALTARKLASPDSRPEDFTRPGHMVPLRAREGGVLTRRGHTEAAIGLWLSCMFFPHQADAPSSPPPYRFHGRVTYSLQTSVG